MIRSDDQLLAAMRQSAHEELLFFSNKGKQARERWVVSQFLKRISVPYSETELISPDQDSEDDVRFRDANFQVKEILNPGAKRGEEVRSTYERLKSAKTLQDVVGPSFTYDVPSPTSIYALVQSEATLLAASPKYVATKTELDLLFYVTRTRASPVRQLEINEQNLANLGWRSISYVAGNHAAVLFAQSHAPAVLRK